jgi:1-acyl-sn-glycerol-3-phosphate acyltransferase
MFNMVEENLPLFLEPSDYASIDSATKPENIDKALENDLRNLLSPASFAMKQMIVRDPLGINSIALRKLGQFQNDENYIMVNGRIFSRDTSYLLMFISPHYSSRETSKNSDFLRILKSSFDRIESDHNVDISVFGSALIAVGNAERLKKDIRFTLTISIILLALIITFSIKKKKLFPFIFLPAIFGGIMAIAVLYLMRGKVSVISLSIGSVILAITVDYALHITTHYKHRHSIFETIKDVSFPIIICGFATAFEFLALVFVSSESLNELGILAAVSVVTAAFFTMVVLPHILEVTTTKSDETEEKNLLEKVLDRITRYSFYKNRLLLGFMIVYSVTALFYLKRVGFETDMMKMNFMPDDLRHAENVLNRINNAKLNSIYVVAYGNNIQQALESNERVIAKAGELRSSKIVKSYSSPGSLLMSDSVQVKKIEVWNDYWNKKGRNEMLKILDDKAVKAGFRPGSFFEFSNRINYKYAPDSSLFITLKNLFSIDNVSVRPDLASIVTVLKVEARDVENATKSFDKIPGVMVIDRKSALSGMVNTLGQDFNFIANISLLLILVVLIVAFGRIELGVITFVPIFLSWIWTLGFMGIFGIKFNIFNIIISSFITGLGIDYSIYIMQGLVQGYKSDNRNLLSYKTCILISVIISLAGTGVLIFAKHPALNSIALISMVGLLSVVLISYTFEPLMFYYLVSRNNKARSLPVTLSDIAVTIVVFAIFVFGCIFMNFMLLAVLLLPVRTKHKKLLLHRGMMIWCKIPVYTMLHIKKKIINVNGEDFSKPAVIISNHQSHIDLLLLLMLHPKLIVLTTRWVWNNPIYALVIRYLNYYPVMEGHGDLTEKLRVKVNEGYSVVIFPEGSRSADSSITRFHKGAFLLAHTLGLDILPVIIHGAGDCMNKGENHLRGGSITLKIFPRVKPGDPNYGSDYHEMKNFMLLFYRKQYALMKEEFETPDYFRRKLIRNYIYKGPVIEWYTRIKLSLENNYKDINALIPRNAAITDIGCGYGYLSHMLSFVSPQRKIIAYDYDTDKIEMAANCISKQPNVEFNCADITEVRLTHSDIFILSDVLHYLPENKQDALIERCIEYLNEGGKIIIRDADRDLAKRHRGTQYTEFFSTRSGFNKAEKNRLYFFSGSKIKKIAERNRFEIIEIDKTKLTSNVLYVMEKGKV